MAKTKELTFEVSLNQGLAGEMDFFHVTGEEVLLYSMLANLIKNALEASPEGERVTVALDSHDRRLITIHNAGAVPPQIRDRFFDKYVTSDKKAGTGLGTYSAQLMAEIQGGTIRMETSEQTGTSLIIEFPQPEGLENEDPVG